MGRLLASVRADARLSGGAAVGNVRNNEPVLLDEISIAA
jgi:hypothetical protein